ncbi:hypothetical protein [Paenibacillus sp. P46E]|uniref:hypothetical protein n=1 Tax=Paenibacillus sp. P46E TaxID=1349436 RepID=UPI000938EDD2|nr:hypothetical protein [Paenibacillus sp. P46E]OKP97794.1 hypothetical protein A3849_13910 [Paenibacillus sp. P46E]
MAMIRIQTTYNDGCEQVERVVEVDDITTLSNEERAQLFDLAERTINYGDAVYEDPSTVMPAMSAASILAMSPSAGQIYPVEVPSHASHLQHLVKLGLFERDFIIRHKLEALRIIHDAEVNRVEQQQITQSLMRDLGINTEECSMNTSESG